MIRRDTTLLLPIIFVNLLCYPYAIYKAIYGRVALWEGWVANCALVYTGFKVYDNYLLMRAIGNNDVGLCT